MADSDREEELDAQGLHYDFGLSHDAVLQGLRLRLYPFQHAGPSEDPAAVLLARLEINGSSHHLEAIAVLHANEAGDEWDPLAEPGAGIVEPYHQVAAALLWEDKLQQYKEAAGDPGEPFEEVTLNHRRYILGMTPYCM